MAIYSIGAEGVLKNKIAMGYAALVVAALLIAILSGDPVAKATAAPEVLEGAGEDLMEQPSVAKSGTGEKSDSTLVTLGELFPARERETTLHRERMEKQSFFSAEAFSDLSGQLTGQLGPDWSEVPLTRGLLQHMGPVLDTKEIEGLQHVTLFRHQREDGHYLGLVQSRAAEKQPTSTISLIRFTNSESD